MDSVAYYNQNAQSFFDRTILADMSSGYASFLPLLAPGAKILDAGCGSGRDALYFKKSGFTVVAFDASFEMVKISSNLLGEPTLQLRFQDLTFQEEFDAIWANASLLHIPYEELRSVLQKLHRCLKPSGVLHMSFKYGSTKRLADDRMFYDMNETTILPYLEQLFIPIEIKALQDTRSRNPSPAQAWLHILARKHSI